MDGLSSHSRENVLKRSEQVPRRTALEKEDWDRCTGPCEKTRGAPLAQGRCSPDGTDSHWFC